MKEYFGNFDALITWKLWLTIYAYANIYNQVHYYIANAASTFDTNLALVS
jgi:hypothetical protein